MICPACKGKCWVDSQYKGPAKCPVCDGNGSVEEKKNNETLEKKTYDQDKFWIDLVKSTDSFEDSLKKSIDALSDVEPVDVIVHLITRGPVVPTGGVILRHMLMSVSSHTKQEPLSRNQLISRGYIVDDDGKIVTVNDIPIGRFYKVLEEWSESYDHLFFGNDPVKIDPNRKGNPFFMDDNKAAIGVTCPCLADLKLALDALNDLSDHEIVRVGIHQI